MNARDTKISRKKFLQLAGAAGLASSLASCSSSNSKTSGAGPKPLLLGLTTDASGMYANSGPAEYRGIQFAIDEFNARGGVLNRPIKFIHQDTETTPATASRIAHSMITREGSSSESAGEIRP